jgi:hypothetical protein
MSLALIVSSVVFSVVVLVAVLGYLIDRTGG